MSILQEANDLKDTLVQHRRYIHENAEQHLDLPKTAAYVQAQLTEMGYETQRLGSSGLVAMAGGKKPGKVFLLRGDMDALPILEESYLSFKCPTGSMHACGHDFHTAMLLGAAKLLKAHENEIDGQIKLMFQPAEETLRGCQMMIDGGVLTAPAVDAAMMIHVAAGLPAPAGTVIIADPKRAFSAADWFRVEVQGKGCHGAMPDTGVDPLNVLAHIFLAYQGINAREISPLDTIALTVGQMHGGAISNVVPDTAFMAGTLRSMDGEVRDFVKNRLVEIAEGIGQTFRAEVTVHFEGGCPNFHINKDLNTAFLRYAIDLVGEAHTLDMSTLQATAKSMGSEDFACIAALVPTTMVMLGTGSPAEGYPYPVHHPKVTFSEDALPVGAAVYANFAMRWLADNR